MPPRPSDSLRLHLATVPHTFSDGATCRRASWPELADTFRAFGEKPAGTYRKKAAVPLWIGADLGGSEGERLPDREQTRVRSVSIAAVDLDGATPEAILVGLRWLSERGIAFILHSTWKHTPEKPKLRVVIPLSAPVPAAEWLRVWASLVSVWEGAPGLDQSCKDPGRGYYMPSLPAGAPLASPMVRVSDGRPLDPDELPEPLPGALEAAAEGKGPSKVTVDDLRRLAANLAKSKRPEAWELARGLRDVADGHALDAAEGERHALILRLTTAIARAFPALDPVQAASLWERTISHKSMGGKTTTEIRDALAGALRKGARERVEREEGEEDLHRRRCSEAWGEGPEGRSTDYRPEELATLASRYAPHIPGESAGARLRNRWILARGRLCWALGPRGYMRTDRDTLPIAARVWLAPARSAGVSMLTENPDGSPRPLSAFELLDRYGSEVGEIGYEIGGAEGSSYDPADRRLWISSAPASTLPPISEKDRRGIEQWLRLLAGDRYPELLQWLAYAPDVSRPLAALALIGEGGAGKSLLSVGLSQLWGGRYVKFADLFGQWTDALKNSPLVWADESVSPAGASLRERGLHQEQVKEWIASPVKAIAERYVGAGVVRGCHRFVFSLQDRELLRVQGELTRAGASALSQRIAMIDVCPEAQGFLESQPAATLDRWRAKAIAQFARWAEAHAKKPTKKRFAVEIDSTEVQQAISASSGLGSKVVEAVASILRDVLASSRKASPSCPIQLRKGADGVPVIAVSATALHAEWTALFPQGEPPGQRAIARQLSLLSETETIRLHNVRHYCVVPRTVREHWEAVGLGALWEALLRYDRRALE